MVRPPWGGGGVGGLDGRDLHETNNPKREPQIDTVGWLFLAFAVAIAAAAVLVAYDANDTMVANAPVSCVVAR
jgi:hypothetical protein